MGYSSYDCAHCRHPILDPGWTTRFVNDWMSKGVLLLENGSRIIGTMDDEHHRLGEFHWGDLHSLTLVFAHYACWAHDGKPEFEGYKEPSQYSNQDTLTREGHDMPEPGTTPDPKLWDAAIRLRTERARRETVRQVAERLDPPDYKRESGYGPDYHRFEATHIEMPKEGKPDWWPTSWQEGWAVQDRAYISDLDGDAVYGLATEEEAIALAKKKSKEWREGEAAAMLAEFQTWQKHYLDEWTAELRATGVRFTAEEHPYHGNPNWRIKDEDDYRLDLEFSDPEDAKRKAKELNDKWLADGMPIDHHTGAEWDHPMGFILCELGYDDPDATPIFCAEAEEKAKR